MGLHAHIRQVGHEVMLTLAGEFRSPEFDQLAAILSHYQSRGCRLFVLDLSRAKPLTTDAVSKLRKLMGATGSATPVLEGSAIRLLLADTPAARPRAGRRVAHRPAA
jgi:hypothetical protein